MLGRDERKNRTKLEKCPISQGFEGNFSTFSVKPGTCNGHIALWKYQVNPRGSPPGIGWGIYQFPVPEG